MSETKPNPQPDAPPRGFLPNRLLCWIQTLWRSSLSYPPVLGHDFVEIELHTNATVQVLRCEVCGKETIAWSL